MKTNQLTSLLIKELTNAGILCWRQNNQPTHDTKMNNGYGGYRAHNGMKGVPDVIAIIDGQFIGLEVKAGKDRMSPEQILFKRRCERAGGKYVIIKEKEDVDKLLTSIVRTIR